MNLKLKQNKSLKGAIRLIPGPRSKQQSKNKTMGICKCVLTLM